MNYPRLRPQRKGESDEAFEIRENEYEAKLDKYFAEEEEPKKDPQASLALEALQALVVQMGRQADTNEALALRTVALEQTLAETNFKLERLATVIQDHR